MHTQSINYRVISAGTLASNSIWNEGCDVRTPHATTTLITAGDVNILVDPSLPDAVLLARLHERTPMRIDQITHVFLTSFEPFRRRALNAFPDAQWLLAERERDAARDALNEQRVEAEQTGDRELLAWAHQELRILESCRAAPDRLAQSVDLFPLPGITPGTCGLILPLPRATVVIAGDAVATIDHLEAGQILQDAADLSLARESFAEVVEIADIIVPGRDHLVINPMRAAR